MLVPIRDTESLAKAIRIIIEGKLKVDLESAYIYSKQFSPVNLAKSYLEKYLELLNY